jgi:hypothetical protein
MNQLRQDQTDVIDVFAERSSDVAPREHLAQVVDSLTYNEPRPIGADALPIDDEPTISEVEIRERLIEWLVGFLPSGLRVDQASH